MLWSLLKIGLFFAIPIVLIMITPVIFDTFDRLKIESALSLIVVCIFLIVCMASSVFLIHIEFRHLIDRANEIYMENTAPDMPVLDGLYDNPQVETETYRDSKYGGR